MTSTMFYGDIKRALLNNATTPNHPNYISNHPTYISNTPNHQNYISNDPQPPKLHLQPPPTTPTKSPTHPNYISKHPKHPNYIFQNIITHFKIEITTVNFIKSLFKTQ